MRRSFLIIFSGLLIIPNLNGQEQGSRTDKPTGIESQKDEDMGEVIDKGVTVPEANVFDFSNSAKAERDRLMKILKTEVEPNLMRGDVGRSGDAEKLKRNVMRLGSYRRDWSQSALDLLAANSALSELYLYQYSMIKNARLNAMILETLLKLDTLRYPTAAVAFFSFFILDRNQMDHAVLLLEKAVSTNPSIAQDAVQLIGGSLGDSIGLATRLKFAHRVCEKGNVPSPALDIIKQWKQEAKEFWERLVAAELDSCVRGL